MTTHNMLRQQHIPKDRLIKLFHQMGAPLSEPTLNQRLKDQKWTIQHVRILQQLNVWVEPEPIDIPIEYIDELFL